MKVAAINGSSRMEKGYTDILARPFLQGMREAGAEVELFYAKRLMIKPCTGEFHCWDEKPGECYQHDEMQTLYPKLREANILVLAVPVYIPLPGVMQNLINRLCPLLEPILEIRDGRTRARLRSNVQIQRIVLVSTGGWWEIGNFNTLVGIAAELAETMGIEFSGALLRPHAYLMIRKGELTKKGEEILDAARKAGQALVRHGKIPEDLSTSVSRPLISSDAFVKLWNRRYGAMNDQTDT
ncbi:MAG: flavodoxin family protein [Spirochaetaceae bacterium]|nr:MAG: flavodoxin family protein [Spirochaetaceae bacterium]